MASSDEPITRRLNSRGVEMVECYVIPWGEAGRVTSTCTICKKKPHSSEVETHDCRPRHTVDNVKLHGVKIRLFRLTLDGPFPTARTVAQMSQLMESTGRGVAGHFGLLNGTTCFCCLGPYHEATGHRFEFFPDVVYCGACTRYMKDFVKGMMSRTVGKTAGFYEAAATSIRAGVYPGEGVELWQ